MHAKHTATYFIWSALFVGAIFATSVYAQGANLSDTVSDLIEHGSSVSPEEPPVPPHSDPLVDTVEDIIESAHLLNEDGAPQKPLTEMEALQQDVAAIREQMEQLQETLVILYDKILKDLEEENEALKREVQRLHARQTGIDPHLLPHVPRPDADIIEQALRSPLPQEETWEAYPEGQNPDQAPLEDALVAPEALPLDGQAPLNYVLVEEWGRSPEVAADLGDDVSSLKGIVCVVPPGVEPASVKELGRKLHAQFSHYDNINIEIFDSEEAAHNYAKNNVPDTAHQVLSVSKHRASGRDAIIYYDEGAPINVPF